LEVTNYLTDYHPKNLIGKFTVIERSNKDSLLNIKEKNSVLKETIY